MGLFGSTAENWQEVTQKEKRFLDAARYGDLHTVSALLRDGIDVNIRDGRGVPKNRSALMHAAENGHSRVIDVLFAAGAEVDAKDKGISPDLPGGNTALILAINNGHVRVAERLLDAGASSKTRGGGTTVLCAAAELGDVSLVRRLLNLAAC